MIRSIFAAIAAYALFVLVALAALAISAKVERAALAAAMATLLLLAAALLGGWLAARLDAVSRRAPTILAALIALAAIAVVVRQGAPAMGPAALLIFVYAPAAYVGGRAARARD